MDSDSLQSSSGASEEYDSRAASDSISAFLNNSPSLPNQPQPPLHHHMSALSSASMLDHSLYNFNPSSRSPQNLDTILSKIPRSEPNRNEFIGTQPPQQLLANQPNQNRGCGVILPSGSGASYQIPNQNMVRNPKKRSRASRRAPTTVLTTDTTNFRAMVQEFTGIPAPPFTSSAFHGNRFDLFGSASSMRSTNPLNLSSPPYLSRPFAQKIQPPPLPNPFFNFQTFKNQFPSSAITGNKFQGSMGIPLNDSSTVKIGDLDEIGLGHVVSSDRALRRSEINGDDYAPRWRSDGGAGGSDENLLKSVNANGKVDFSGSCLDFGGGKGPENVGGGRSEGMVESWICD